MKTEWISVKDRLPEKPKPNERLKICIVSGIEDGQIYVYYSEIYPYGDLGGCFSVPGWSDMNVTHWMPLPEPPTQ